MSIIPSAGGLAAPGSPFNLPRSTLCGPAAPPPATTRDDWLTEAGSKFVDFLLTLLEAVVLDFVPVMSLAEVLEDEVDFAGASGIRTTILTCVSYSNGLPDESQVPHLGLMEAIGKALLMLPASIKYGELRTTAGPWAKAAPSSPMPRRQTPHLVALAHALEKTPCLFPDIVYRKVEQMKSIVEVLRLELTREDLDDINNIATTLGLSGDPNFRPKDQTTSTVNGIHNSLS
ncbi:aryl-alcohol dehydrogenase [Apiospora sp. TS-2023a]